MALIGISGSAHGAPPPNRPTMTSLPPLVRQSKPSCVVLALPTRSITARIGPPAFCASCSSAACAPPPHGLQHRQRHQAKTAGTENDDRRIETGLDLLQGAVGGDAGARVRR